MKIAFDFDMTLVDSNNGVLATLTRAFQEACVQMIDDVIPRFNTLRGQNLDSQLRGMAAEPLSQETLEYLKTTFGLLYPEIGVAGTRIFPEVIDIFDFLRSKGIETHIISAKGENNLEISMRKLAIHPSAWRGGLFGVEKSRYLRSHDCTTYVGDMQIDVEIARQALCKSVIINNAKEDVGTWTHSPDILFQTTEEFFDWLKIPENLEIL